MSSELEQLRTAEQLPADLMLLKMENESIMAVARAAPRDPMKIVAQLQQLIDAYPAAADEAIYVKPVGTVQQCTCGDCGIKYEVNKVEKDTACPGCESRNISGQRAVKKFAEGLSIRAAESIRSIYGYTRLATTCELLDNGSAKITGTLVDYAAGNLTSDERIVSPYYRAKSGAMTRTPDDRFLSVVVKAEKSKLRRDVILDSVPNIVKAMFRDACEHKLAALVSPEVVSQKIIPAFAAYGITQEHLDRLVGRPATMGWTEEDRLSLRKMLNALKNEETTAAELLDGIRDEPASPPASATADALRGTPSAANPAASKHAPNTKQQVEQQQAAAGNPLLAARVIADIDFAKTPQDVDKIYDAACGPDSSLDLTADDVAEIERARAARKAAIEAAK